MDFNRIFSRGRLALAIAAPALAWPIAASSSPAAHSPAAHNPVVTTDSAVFVERRGPDSARQLEPSDSFTRGDRVITIVRWHRMGGNGGFTITNPLPRTITFQKSSRTDEEVSVDGGRTWGRLGQLTVGSRLATPEDVTHVRWRISPRVALEGSGEIAYSAVVR